MIGQQEIVKLIIQSPISEYQDVHNINARSLYKNLVLPCIGNTLVKVSIEYPEKFDRTRGFVRTAYATDNVKGGEIWLWGHKFEN